MTEDGLMGPRQQILAQLHTHGEPVSTSILRRELDDEIDVLYHLKSLQNRGLIEYAGDVQTGTEGRGQKAKSHRLTEEGQERAAAMFGSAPIETVSALANRIEDHEARLSAQEEAINDTDDTLDLLRGEIRRLDTRIDTILERIKNYDD